MIAIDLSKQKPLDVDTRAIKNINFTANLGRARNTRRGKRNCIGLFTRSCKSIVNVLYNNLNLSNIK